MKSITLISCKEMDSYVQYDHLLSSELESRGHKVQTKFWENLTDEGEDLFLIRTTWNYFDHLEEFINKLEPVQNRLYNSLPIVKWNSNKKYLEELYNKDLPVLPLKIVNNKNSLLAAINDLGGEEFIIKPLVSASAIGLHRFNRNDPPEIDSEMILQKFHPEIKNGEVSLFFFNGEFKYAIKKVPKENDIRVQEEYGGVLTQYKPSPQDLDWASQVVKHIPEDWLYARVDIIPGIGLIELELIEPSLYLGKYDKAHKIVADAIESRL